MIKQIEKLNNIDFEVISCTERCIQCKFRYEIVLEDIKRVSISCSHPRGPGNPLHCIYFKRGDS
ncbi:MAG: hypothetical protein ACLPWD_07835 [Methanobacterium sp.]